MIGKKLWSVVHFLMLLVLLYWNFLANNGSLPATMGEISNRYDTLFTPAGYTFSIWGFIYLGLLALSIYMLVAVFKKSIQDDFVQRSAPYLFFTYFLMTLWLWFWSNDHVMYALIVMSLILGNLILVVIRLRMQLVHADFKHTFFVWWPIDMLFGWICVATIANVAVYLQKTQWEGWGFSDTAWAYLMIGVVCILGLILTTTRNMREVSYVFIWALIGIAVKNWDVNESIALLCFGACFTLFFLNLYHISQNPHTLPWKRKGEEKSEI